MLLIFLVFFSTFLEIGEDGVEATGNTMSGLNRIGAFGEKYFEVDHPFVFFLWDYHSGILLFLGRVTTPEPWTLWMFYYEIIDNVIARLWNSPFVLSSHCPTKKSIIASATRLELCLRFTLILACSYLKICDHHTRRINYCFNSLIGFSL